MIDPAYDKRWSELIALPRGDTTKVIALYIRHWIMRLVREIHTMLTAGVADKKTLEHYPCDSFSLFGRSEENHADEMEGNGIGVRDCRLI